MNERVIIRVDRSGPFVLFVERPADVYGRKCQSTRGPVDVKQVIHISHPAPSEVQYRMLRRGWRPIQRDTPATKKVRLAAAYVEEMPHVAGYETANKPF